MTTIGVDFRFKTMIINNKICKIQIWDTAGQERYRSITTAYYRGADAIFIIFDITNKESFVHIDDWIHEIIKYTGENILIVIGGNKIDLNNKEVTTEDIEVYKRRKKIKAFLVSAKSGEGVEKAFKNISEILMDKFRGQKDFSGNGNFNVGNENFERSNNNNKNRCCGN